MNLEVEGYIEKVIYRSEESGYTVLTLVHGSKEWSLTGIFPEVSEGEYILAQGEVTEHPMYGEQMKVTSFTFAIPSTAAGIQRYLASGAVKGIKASLAERIVKKFGDDTFRIMEEEPERLAEVKGISEKKAMDIAMQMSEKRDGRKAMMFLQEYGITWNMAVKIYAKYGEQVYAVMKNNPYQLADDIDGIGFKIADEIAVRTGIQADSEFRIRSGILYTLQQGAAQGHTYLPLEILKREAANLLEVAIEEIEKYFTDLIMDKKLMIREMEGVQVAYGSQYYYLELNVARMLHDLNVKGSVSEREIERKLRALEHSNDLELDEMQRNAVKEAVNNGLLIVTGGPGTGKTTTINAIIQYFERSNMEILLAAPTGRAAKRMSEATGREAMTIHRLLEVNGNPEQQDGSASYFNRNENMPLEADVVIIDETSMVDIFLMHSLLRAVAPGTRLIFVGDVNQLPSVGPGNVLRDMIEANCFCVVKLTKIFRQAAESEIVRNAHKINRGEIVEPTKGSKDFLFVKRDNAGMISGACVTLVKDKLPAYVNADIQEIQVMTPMRKGVLGVENLNIVMQQYLNPPSNKKEEKQVGQVTFRVGDKVMQIKNNYQLEWEIVNSYGTAIKTGQGIFNGDTGRIQEINHFSEEIVVEFDEKRRVNYSFKQAEELELAYVITIHKAQGSEYPAVVIPLLTGPKMLMNRNLLYTAVTRARKCVCIVGSVETFQAMIANEREQMRYSGLDEHIKEIQQQIQMGEI